MRIFLVVAITLVATGVSAQAPAPSFCERLAPQLEMKEKTSRKGGDTRWEVDTLGGLKTFLVGGSTLVSFRIEPVGEPTVEAYQRLEDTCQQEGKEMICTVAEPLNLKVQVKDVTAEVESLEGENAMVIMKGSRISCRDS